MYECFSEESKKIKKNGTPSNLSYTQLLDIIKTKIGHRLKPSLSTEDNEQLTKVICLFLCQTQKMLQSCKSNKNVFKKRHKKYLEKSFLADIPSNLKSNVTTCSTLVRMDTQTDTLTDTPTDTQTSRLTYTLTGTLTDSHANTHTDTLTGTQTCTQTDILRQSHTDTLTVIQTDTLTNILSDKLTVYKNISPFAESCKSSVNVEEINNNFESAYYSTLAQTSSVFISADSFECNPSTDTGKTIPDNEVHYEKLSYRQQLRSRKCIASVLEDQPRSKLIKTFATTVEADGNKLSPKAAKDLEQIIHTCLKSPNRATKISKNINFSIQPYTPEEALGLIIDRRLNIETYKVIQQEAKFRGCKLYPPYSKILEARKACHPTEQIFVSDVEASVSLQGILDHTF